jgi:hypothetical protein
MLEELLRASVLPIMDLGELFEEVKTPKPSRAGEWI